MVPLDIFTRKDLEMSDNFNLPSYAEPTRCWASGRELSPLASDLRRSRKCDAVLAADPALRCRRWTYH